MKILITGGTGYIGTKLIQHLMGQDKKGLEIAALVRSATCRRFDFSVRLIQGDLTSLSRHVFQDESFDVVIHLAALMANCDHLPKERFYETNVSGTQALITALADCHVKQFIHISTTSVYGPTKSVPTGEETPCGKKLSRYAWSKAESEKIAAECCPKTGIPLTILRIGPVYGEDMKYGWPHVIQSIEKRRMKIIGSGRNLIQLAYIRDVIEGIALSIGNKGAYNATFNICGKDVRPIQDIFYEISSLLGVPKPGNIPFVPLYILSGLLNLFPRSMVPPSLRLLTPSRMSFFKDNHVYSIQKAKEILGFSPRYPISIGMKNTVTAYKEKKHV